MGSPVTTCPVLQLSPVSPRAYRSDDVTKTFFFFFFFFISAFRWSMMKNIHSPFCGNRFMGTRARGGGGTRMAREGIRLVHGHTKSTLITYFSGMKMDPKYAFLHTFFLICPSCPVQNLSRAYMTKNTHFSPLLHVFCTPKRCTRVQYLVLKKQP